MSWNRPSANPQREKNKSASERRNVSIFCGLATTFVVLLVGTIFWWCRKADDVRPMQSTNSEAPKVIREVTPAPAPKPVAKPKEAEPPKYWDLPTTNGLTPRQAKVWYWKRRPKPSITNDSSLTETPPAYCIFTHECDNRIALYLSLNPGDTLVGSMEYGESFKKDFAESIKEPIIVTKDDDEWTANLKRSVSQTKIELIDRMNAGEDIGKILEDTHDEFRRLYLYKTDIEQAFREQIRNSENLTEEDVNDAIKAANMMLDEKGIAPMKIGNFTKKLLLRHVKPKTEN